MLVMSGDFGSKNAIVTVDGAAVTDVVMADSTAGVVRRMKRVGGNLVMDPELGQFEMETIRGTVEISYPDQV